MRMKPTLELTDAEAIVAGCRSAAVDLAASTAIAVVDEAGVLLQLVRLPGAKPHTVDFAVRKARTAALLGLSTTVLEQMAREGRQMGGDTLALGGGLPVLAQGQCAGGVGVSGS